MRQRSYEVEIGFVTGEHVTLDVMAPTRLLAIRKACDSLAPEDLETLAGARAVEVHAA